MKPTAFGIGTCVPVRRARLKLGKVYGLGYGFPMAEIVNLNQFRKQKSRDAKRQEADENATKFGRSKTQKTLEKSKQDKAKRDLDGHERE